MLAATRVDNDRLMAELVRARQVVQHTSDLEAGRIAAQAKAAEMAARKVMDAKAMDALLHHQRRMHATAAADPLVQPTCTTKQPPPQTSPPPSGVSSTGDRESTPDMQKVGILYPLRESGMGGCVGKGSGTEEMRTLEKKNLKWEFLGWKRPRGW